MLHKLSMLTPSTKAFSTVTRGYGEKKRERGQGGSGPFNPHTKEKWSQTACKVSF